MSYYEDLLTKTHLVSSTQVMKNEDHQGNPSRLSFSALFKLVGHGATATVKPHEPHTSLDDVTIDDLECLEWFLSTRVAGLAESEARNNLTPASRQALHLFRQATNAINQLQDEQVHFLGYTHELASSFSR